MAGQQNYIDVKVFNPLPQNVQDGATPGTLKSKLKSLLIHIRPYEIEEFLKPL